MSQKGNSKTKNAKLSSKKEKEQKNSIKGEKDNKKTQEYENVGNNQLRLNNSAEPNYITIERQLVLTFSDGEKHFQYIRTKSELFSFLETILEPTNDTYHNEERHVEEINILIKTKKKTEPPEEEEDPIHLFVLKQINKTLLEYHLQRKRFIDLKQNAIGLGEKTPNISNKNKKDTMQKNKWKPKNTYTERNLSNESVLNSAALDNNYQTKGQPMEKEFSENIPIADTIKVEPSKLHKVSSIPSKSVPNKRMQPLSSRIAKIRSDEKDKKQFFKKNIDKFDSSLCWKYFDNILLMLNIAALTYLQIYFPLKNYTISYVLAYGICCFIVISALIIFFLNYIIRKKNLADKLARLFLIIVTIVNGIVVIYSNELFSKNIT